VTNAQREDLEVARREAIACARRWYMLELERLIDCLPPVTVPAAWLNDIHYASDADLPVPTYEVQEVARTILDVVPHGGDCALSRCVALAYHHLDAGTVVGGDKYQTIFRLTLDVIRMRRGRGPAFQGDNT
jgi:hypothetical protein